MLRVKLKQSACRRSFESVSAANVATGFVDVRHGCRIETAAIGRRVLGLSYESRALLKSCEHESVTTVARDVRNDVLKLFRYVQSRMLTRGLLIVPR